MIGALTQDKKALIMVVDDSETVRFSIRQFLELENYDVIDAIDGLDAIKLYNDHEPDIILMNYIMPQLDGPSTCLRLNAASDNITVPIIMISSLEDESSINNSFESGASDYVTTPINFPILKQRIAQLIKTKNTQHILKKSTAFATSIVSHAKDGIITIDEHGIILFQNPASEQILGYNDEEIIGQNINYVIPDLYYKSLDSAQFEPNIATTDDSTFGILKNQESIRLEIATSQFSIDSENYYTITFKDITKRYEYEEMIRYRALYDPLTTLPNRLLLKERMIETIDGHKDSLFKFGIVYLDLDRFKLINDTLGHDVGDKLLVAVSERLATLVNDECTIARIGGDEFVLIIPNITDENELCLVSDNILKIVRKPFFIDQHEIYISASIGITTYPTDSDSEEKLLTNADIAMYRAKEMGKNNYQVYTATLNEKAIDRLALENSLRRAIDYEEFVLHYQPKVDTNSEKIIGMEALIRWQHPDKGMVMPNDFIPLAEDTGLIVPIGEWVLKTACKQNKSLQDYGLPPITVAVNLSARQFELQDFRDVVLSVLKDTQMKPEYLELEITESIAMQNVEHTLTVINELIELGVKFSIDDFGTGYSSLSQLSSFSVNKLKIDKSFVDKIDGDESNNIMASTILALGKSLDLGIVAEGVETEDQVAFLRENLCDEMQGFFFGKPMTSSKFSSFYAQQYLQDMK